MPVRMCERLFELEEQEQPLRFVYLEANLPEVNSENKRKLSELLLNRKTRRAIKYFSNTIKATHKTFKKQFPSGYWYIAVSCFSFFNIVTLLCHPLSSFDASDPRSHDLGIVLRACTVRLQSLYVSVLEALRWESSFAFGHVSRIYKSTLLFCF